jgi:hypothetical protein
LCAVSLAACFLLSACNKHPGVVKAADIVSSSSAAVVSRTGKSHPGEPRRAEPLAVAEREKSIRRDADAIRAECQRAASGDWEKWQNDTAAYRAALRKRIAELKRNRPGEDFDLRKGPGMSELFYQPLEGRGEFPLVEVGAHDYLTYLIDTAAFDRFRKDNAVVAAHRWLRQRGVDLIFVPVPKMTEVYIEQFVEPSPTDGVIAPHVRRTLWELLDGGVEIVDAFALFRPKRQPEPEYLYLAADAHWGPPGMRLAARELASRIARYEFGKTASQAAPVVRCVPEGGTQPAQYGFEILNEKQRERARAVTRNPPSITALDGGDVLDNPESPVLLIGNSYARHFREVLVQELNLLVRSNWSPGQTTEAFADFVRQPEVLDGRQVVVWISTVPAMATFKPLPAPIAAAGQAK